VPRQLVRRPRRFARRSRHLARASRRSAGRRADTTRLCAGPTTRLGFRIRPGRPEPSEPFAQPPPRRTSLPFQTHERRSLPAHWFPAHRRCGCYGRRRRFPGLRRRIRAGLRRSRKKVHAAHGRPSRPTPWSWFPEIR